MTRHTSLPGALPVLGQLLLVVLLVAPFLSLVPRYLLPADDLHLVTSGRFALAAHELLRRPKSSSKLLFAVM